jgi:dTDP-glucose 4,6-dehydratase
LGESNLKLLVTGGLGFIGSNFIVKAIVDRGIKILNIDAKTYAGDPKNVEEVRRSELYSETIGDIRDRALLTQSLTAFRPDIIVNFAAESHVDRSINGPSDFVTTNVNGTFELLEATREYWYNVLDQNADFRFFHVSTDEVYGALGPEDLPFTESHRYDPSSPYSASKAASDHLVRAYGRTFGIPYLISNCSNNYGPKQHREKLIPTVIGSMLSGSRVPIYGDGNQVRDWIHVSDHCDAIMKIIDTSKPFETFNVGGQCEVPNIEVVRSIYRSLSNQIEGFKENKLLSLIEHVSDRLGHDRRYAINNSKIQSQLGWSPKIAFSQGIDDTVAWYIKSLGLDG